MRSLLIAALAAGVLIAGCGLNIQSPDLFLLTRTGQSGRLTLLVNDSGTISCNGAKPKTLADTLLIQARDLAQNLDADAKARLHIPPAPNSIDYYTIKLQDGTVRFPDTAGARHRVLADAELFAVQAAQQACGLPG